MKKHLRVFSADLQIAAEGRIQNFEFTDPEGE